MDESRYANAILPADEPMRNHYDDRFYGVVNDELCDAFDGVKDRDRLQELSPIDDEIKVPPGCKNIRQYGVHLMAREQRYNKPLNIPLVTPGTDAGSPSRPINIPSSSSSKKSSGHGHWLLDKPSFPWDTPPPHLKLKRKCPWQEETNRQRLEVILEWEKEDAVLAGIREFKLKKARQELDQERNEVEAERFRGIIDQYRQWALQESRVSYLQSSSKKSPSTNKTDTSTCISDW